MLINLLYGGLDFYSALAQILAILAIVFLVLPFHEWAHAFTASKLGDTSIKYRGRLTLNPLAHIDPFGALSLLLFGFGWAKPVPVDPRNFKKPKSGMAIVALMGPVANIVAAIVGGLIYHGIDTFTTGFFPMLVDGRMYSINMFGYYVYIFLQFYIRVNASLAVFNLIPVPPLDGSKILFAFLKERIVYMICEHQRAISIGLIVLLMVGSYFPVFPFNILTVTLNYLSYYLTTFINQITAFPFSLFA